MTPAALKIIRDEHRTFGSIVRAMRRLARATDDWQRPQRLEAFRAMIDYIGSFPEKLHHPKEDEYVFRFLRRKCPDAATVLDLLTAEHRTGSRLVAELDAALLVCEQGDCSEFPAFAEAVERYATFLGEHMRREEEEVLPLAERYLTQADWAVIEAAFNGHTTAEFGAAADAEFSRLIKKILVLAPPPVGIARDV